MLLRKMLSLIGVGSTQIDLVLEKETYKPGEQVRGQFIIKGGTIEQQLKRIDCDLVMVDEQEEKEEVIDYLTILLTDKIIPDCDKSIRFTFQLPDHVQETKGTRSYRFKTRLSFKEGVESIDTDAIRIIRD
jgi:sporulation-control protein